MASNDSRRVIAVADPATLAAAAAERLLARIADNSGRVAICLTGGSSPKQLYQLLAVDAWRVKIPWQRVHWFIGDERFVPADDAERNAKQALDMLAAPLALNRDRIHEMPASDGDLDLDQAAEAYARELDDTVFDICLLGMGPDGHVASIFPEHPSSYAEGAVIAVRASPKPPPERISLTLPVINQSHEVWFVVSGTDKAAAAKMALLGAGPVQVPAAGVSGVERTLWLLDREAAAELPADLQQRGRI